MDTISGQRSTLFSWFVSFRFARCESGVCARFADLVQGSFDLGNATLEAARTVLVCFLVLVSPSMGQGHDDGACRCLSWGRRKYATSVGHRDRAVAATKNAILMTWPFVVPGCALAWVITWVVESVSGLGRYDHVPSLSLDH